MKPMSRQVVPYIMKSIPFITSALVVITLFCGAMPALASSLEFSRDAFARGEIWRLWTAHFVHFGGAHLRWDVLTLLLLGSLAEFKSRRDWIAAFVISAPAIVLAVWWLQPEFAVYRGLSGIDCAAYGVVAGHLLRDGWRERKHGRGVFALGVAGCAGALAKCGYELLVGQPFFVGATDAFAPAPLAHFVGVVVGVVIVCTGASLSLAMPNLTSHPMAFLRRPRMVAMSPQSVIFGRGRAAICFRHPVARR